MIRTPSAAALLLTGLAAAALLSAPVPVRADPKPDAALLSAAKAAYPGELKLLETLVNTDSGTGNVAGGEKIQALLAERLKAAGATVELIPAEAPGLPPNLVATVTGKGKGRVLLIGHIDTVFEPGEAAKRPFRIMGERAYGPGIVDEKAGVVAGVTALELIQQTKFNRFGAITLLLETSEEAGSTGSRALIDRLVKRHDVELNLEPEEKDSITVWRKSSASLIFTVTGRAAHAGVNPQDGRNAASELIHQIEALEAAFPRSGDGVTVNLTVLKAGTRTNIIPAHAEGTLNVRGRTLADMEAVGEKARANAANTIVPDTLVQIEYVPNFPPLVQNARVTAAANLAKGFAAELGRPLINAGNGGASESALADAGGITALDGLGSTGGGFHSPNEYLELESLTPRLYILTRLIETYGARPPINALPAAKTAEPKSRGTKSRGK